MNPWDGLEEIRRFARDGFDSIPPEWIGTYFRWWGVYTQGDGAGVTGGQGGVGRALQRFMVRIRIPNGMMTSLQLRAIADLTRQHANGIADLTVRQNIQLHWVTIESLPEVLDGLWQVGLNTTGACGDVVRNVTGCPVAGVDADEIVDASPLVLRRRNCWPAMPSSTTCRASSRSRSQDAPYGAPTLKSMTLV
jgi:sulfite reductase (ferredoxin)